MLVARPPLGQQWEWPLTRNESKHRAYQLCHMENADLEAENREVRRQSSAQPPCQPLPAQAPQLVMVCQSPQSPRAHLPPPGPPRRRSPGLIMALVLVLLFAAAATSWCGRQGSSHDTHVAAAPDWAEEGAGWKARAVRWMMDDVPAAVTLEPTIPQGLLLEGLLADVPVDWPKPLPAFPPSEDFATSFAGAQRAAIEKHSQDAAESNFLKLSQSNLPWASVTSDKNEVLASSEALQAASTVHPAMVYLMPPLLGVCIPAMLYLIVLSIDSLLMRVRGVPPASADVPAIAHAAVVPPLAMEVLQSQAQCAIEEPEEAIIVTARMEELIADADGVGHRVSFQERVDMNGVPSAAAPLADEAPVDPSTPVLTARSRRCWPKGVLRLRSAPAERDAPSFQPGSASSADTVEGGAPPLAPAQRKKPAWMNEVRTNLLDPAALAQGSVRPFAFKSPRLGENAEREANLAAKKQAAWRATGGG